ncbi:hypothetical protein [Aliiroseovarius sp. 2305UL8-7]|uniref:hypothetical protein n=1 Tax=Aliiroseovarius conchicola TaxID=3121637 RepID=UPI0035299067
MREFLKEGIPVETGVRGWENGFTVVYRIDLARVEVLELTVETGPGTGHTTAPKHPTTIHKPYTREGAEEVDEGAEKVLAGLKA